MIQEQTQTQTVKERLFILMEMLLDEGTMIPRAYVPIIKNVVKGFLKSADEENLKTQIKSLASEYIPWLLGEK